MEYIFINNLFNKIFCISLDRRQDRIRAFFDKFPEDWKYGSIEIIKAIDGKYCRPPTWWNTGNGAWGCYRTHLRILEDCLNNNINEPILIFEDDATFCEDFTNKCDHFFNILPEDWEQAYLGGQHLVNPILIYNNNSILYKGTNINRTHAYALKNYEAIKKIYKWLNSYNLWTKKCHIDHQFGQMQYDNMINAYAPIEWLCGQSESKSDISNKKENERWWQNKNKTPQDNLISLVAIVGLYDSGCSYIAKILQDLGIDMGQKLTAYDHPNDDNLEDQILLSIYKRFYKAKSFISNNAYFNHQVFNREINTWINKRKYIAKNLLFGIKHPYLPIIGNNLIKLCDNKLKIIYCERNLDDAIQSFKDRVITKNCNHQIYDPLIAENIQKYLFEKQKNFLSLVDSNNILMINYEDIQNKNKSLIPDIINFLNINTNE